jgi:mRNA interferase RelE/StbE
VTELVEPHPPVVELVERRIEPVRDPPGVTIRAQWTGPACRDMARLPPRIATAVIVYVEERLTQDPRRLSKELAGEFAGIRSARNGDYRVLFRMDADDEILWILRVQHRAHLYRSR